MSEFVPVTVYLERDVAEFYRRVAGAEDRSISAECRRVLVRHAEQKRTARRSKPRAR